MTTDILIRFGLSIPLVFAAAYMFRDNLTYFWAVIFLIYANNLTQP